MLSPTLLLATTLKISLQLGGRWRAGGSTWRSLSGCSQQQQVKSVPDVLYHPPEMSQLSQACAPCASSPGCHSVQGAVLTPPPCSFMLSHGLAHSALTLVIPSIV